jgi:hypothetical protein
MPSHTLLLDFIDLIQQYSLKGTNYKLRLIYYKHTLSRLAVDAHSTLDLLAKYSDINVSSSGQTAKLPVM